MLPGISLLVCCAWGKEAYDAPGIERSFCDVNQIMVLLLQWPILSYLEFSFLRECALATIILGLACVYPMGCLGQACAVSVSSAGPCGEIQEV